MRILTQLSTLAAIVFVGGSASTALAFPSSEAVELSNSLTPAASVTTVVGDEEQRYIEKGDERAAEGRYGAARRAYREAAEIARADGRLPVVALKRIANSYYFQGRYESAALALEKLADEAEEYGDLTTQVWAIADGAWMYARNGAADAATQDHLWREWEGGKLHVSPDRPRANVDTNRLVAKLERLLESPYLPDDVRREVTEQRLADLTRLTSR